MLNLSMNFTSQYVNTTTKCFDNHTVVISDWYKTEGDLPATEKTTIWIKINGLLLMHCVSSSTPHLLTLHRAWANRQLIMLSSTHAQFSYTHSYIQLTPYLYHQWCPLPLQQIRCLFINNKGIYTIRIFHTSVSTFQVQCLWVNTSRLPLKLWTDTLQTSCPRYPRSERSPLSSWPQHRYTKNFFVYLWPQVHEELLRISMTTGTRSHSSGHKGYEGTVVHCTTTYVRSFVSLHEVYYYIKVHRVQTIYI